MSFGVINFVIVSYLNNRCNVFSILGSKGFLERQGEADVIR